MARNVAEGGVDGQSARLRLFLALELPDPARRAIGVWRDGALAQRPELRPVPDAALHVTLAFLGPTDPGDVEAIGAAAVAAATGSRPVAISVGGVAAVPRRGPRVVALDLNDEGGGAAALRDLTATALADAGLHDRDPRPFWAHLTVARVGRDRHVGLGELPAAPSIESFVAPALTLYRTHLGSGAARYEALRRVELT